MSTHLADFGALTFDCYGTLIDWESGIWDALQPLLMENDCTEMTRAASLRAYAEEESKQQAQTPDMLYPEILKTVHATLARRLDLRSTAALDTTFGASPSHWPAFADSADALRILQAHFKLVILSNIDRDGFAASNRKLGVAFDAVYTAQDVGSYKPAPANFEYMLDRLRGDLGLDATDILHTAQSLFHDHVPARAFGLANAWIDRQGLSEGGDWGATAVVDEKPQFDFLFPDMASMAEAVIAEGGSASP